MDIIENEKNVQYFLDLIKKSRRGKFKLYIGMIAGVGKSYRMLQEAHELLENGVDVKVGFIETHGHRRQLHRGGGDIELPDSLFDAEGLEICSDFFNGHDGSFLSI